MAILTKVDNLEDEWERWIECNCLECETTFEENTEDLDLEDEEPLVECPNCGHISPLTVTEK